MHDSTNFKFLLVICLSSEGIEPFLIKLWVQTGISLFPKLPRVAAAWINRCSSVSWLIICTTLVMWDFYAWTKWKFTYIGITSMYKSFFFLLPMIEFFKLRRALNFTSCTGEDKSCMICEGSGLNESIYFTISHVGATLLLPYHHYWFCLRAVFLQNWSLQFGEYQHAIARKTKREEGTVSCYNSSNFIVVMISSLFVCTVSILLNS